MVFSLLTLAIAFLGLLGMISFLARQRLRELSIRRILGAGSRDIIYLMSRNFILLVLLAALPAFISSRYFIGEWLENFAYQAETNYMLLALALLFTMLLTLITTGLHAWRISRTNPARVLREAG